MADNNGPLTLEELKTYLTPSQNELKQSRDGLEDDDPATPLEEQKAAIDALPAGFTFEGLENCLPEKVQLQCQVRLRSLLTDALRGHAALLTVRRARDAGGALYRSKPDAEKPHYEGERERARKNTSKRPECANKPTHTGCECKVKGPTYNGNELNKTGRNRGQQRRNGATVRPSGGSIGNRGYANKPVANVAKKTKTATIDEIEDAWVCMSIDPETDLSDLPPLVPIRSKQYNVELNAVYPNCDIYNYYPVQRLAGTKHPVAAAAAQQAAPKKAKTAPEVKPLKWCAHMAINGACAFYDCPLDMMVDDVDVGGKGAVGQVSAIDHSPAKKRETTRETTEEWKPPEGGTKTTNAREHTTMQIRKRTFDGRLDA
eukprot:g78266.t1